MSNLTLSLPSLLRLSMGKHGAQSYTTGEVSSLPVAAHCYASPWPDALPGLGPRTVGPFETCARCQAWSWVRYGEAVLCLACAGQAEKGRRP